MCVSGCVCVSHSTRADSDINEKIIQISTNILDIKSRHFGFDERANIYYHFSKREPNIIFSPNRIILWINKGSRDTSIWRRLSLTAIATHVKHLIIMWCLFLRQSLTQKVSFRLHVWPFTFIILVRFVSCDVMWECVCGIAYALRTMQTRHRIDLDRYFVPSPVRPSAFAHGILFSSVRHAHIPLWNAIKSLNRSR